MIAKLRGVWQWVGCLVCLGLGLALLYLGSHNALGQIPPPSGNGAVQFAHVEYYVAQDTGSATIRVTLSPAAQETVTVDYATSDGTATAPDYYTATSGTLTFNPGDTNASFQVPINNTGFSMYYDLNLAISNPTNATLGEINTAHLVIIPPNTICTPTGSDS